MKTTHRSIETEGLEKLLAADGGIEGDLVGEAFSPPVGDAVDAERGLVTSEEAAVASLATKVGGKPRTERHHRVIDRRKRRQRRVGGVVRRDPGHRPEAGL